MSAKTRGKTVKIKQNTKTCTSPHKQPTGTELVTSFENKLDTLTKHYTDVVTSQQFVSSQYDVLMKEMKAMKEQNYSLRSELSAVIKRCTELKNDVNEIKGKMNNNEQEKINTNVLIRGILSTECPMAATKKLAHMSEIEIRDDDLQSVKHVTYNNNKDPVIIAKFNSVVKKREFVKAAKIKRISTHMYGYHGEPRPIYVDEQLTSETFKLFKLTKKLKRIGVQFVWIADGKILVRERANAMIHNIKTMAQLHELEKEIILRKGNNNNNHIVKSKAAHEHEESNSKQNRDNNTSRLNDGAYVRMRNKDLASVSINTKHTDNGIAREISNGMSASVSNGAEVTARLHAERNSVNNNGKIGQPSTSTSAKTGHSANVLPRKNMESQIDNGINCNVATIGNANTVKSESKSTKKNTHSNASVLVVTDSDLDTSELEFVDCVVQNT